LGSTRYCGLGIRAGKLFGWGRNQFGEAGIGNVSQVNSPVQVGAATDWTRVGRNGTLFALGLRGGRMFAWGNNDAGQLGIGSTAPSRVSSPVQVGSETDWTDVALAGLSCACIRAGKLFTWGSGFQGMLGIGDSTSSSRSSPVQVGSETDWTAIAGGNYHFLGLRGGKLFAWGYNLYGGLGLNDVVTRSSPVQVGSATNWTQITGGGDYSAGIRENKLFTWGYNDQGQLGQGNTTPRSSPVQVGSATNWKLVAASESGGSYGFTIAVK